jgi:hypothetical protein
VYGAVTHGFIPVGALLGGLLGDTLGLRPALALAAIALFPSWLVVVLLACPFTARTGSEHERDADGLTAV